MSCLFIYLLLANNNNNNSFADSSETNLVDLVHPKDLGWLDEEESATTLLMTKVS